MEKEQIIKALECCSKDDCDNCPNSFGNCYSNLAGYALALIKELTEENERLSHHCDDCAGCTQWKCDCANIQADTVREFAERLKYTLCINNEENTEFFDYSYTLETIDEVANEILNKNTEE